MNALHPLVLTFCVAACTSPAATSSFEDNASHATPQHEASSSAAPNATAMARASAPSPSAGPAAVTLELDASTGYLIHEVWFDGQGPFTAILDTGNQGTVLFAHVAEELGLETAALGAMTGAGPGSVDVEAANNVAVTLRDHDKGELSWTEPQVVVLPASAAMPPFGGRTIDAFLGASLLDTHRATIDYARGRLTLTPHGEWTPPADAMVLPFELTEGFPHFQGEVAVQPETGAAPITGRFLLDLGAPFGIELEHAEVAERGLLSGPDRRTEGMMSGIDGVPMEIISAPLAHAKLAGLDVLAQPGFNRAILSPLPGGGPPIADLVGSVGSAPFRAGRLTLDYAAGRAVFEAD